MDFVIQQHCDRVHVVILDYSYLTLNVTACGYLLLTKPSNCRPPNVRTLRLLHGIRASAVKMLNGATM